MIQVVSANGHIAACIDQGTCANDGAGVVPDAAHVHRTGNAHHAAANRTGERQGVDLVARTHRHALKAGCGVVVSGLVDLCIGIDARTGVRIDQGHGHATGNAGHTCTGCNGQVGDVFAGGGLHHHAMRRGGVERGGVIGRAGHHARHTRAIATCIDTAACAQVGAGGLGGAEHPHRRTNARHTRAQGARDHQKLGLIVGLDEHIAAGGHRGVDAHVGIGHVLDHRHADRAANARHTAAQACADHQHVLGRMGVHDDVVVGAHGGTAAHVGFGGLVEHAHAHGRRNARTGRHGQSTRHFQVIKIIASGHADGLPRGSRAGVGVDLSAVTNVGAGRGVKHVHTGSHRHGGHTSAATGQREVGDAVAVGRGDRQAGKTRRGAQRGLAQAAVHRVIATVVHAIVVGVHLGAQAGGPEARIRGRGAVAILDVHIAGLLGQSRDEVNREGARVGIEGAQAIGRDLGALAQEGLHPLVDHGHTHRGTHPHGTGHTQRAHHIGLVQGIVGRDLDAALGVNVTCTAGGHLVAGVIANEGARDHVHYQHARSTCNARRAAAGRGRCHRGQVLGGVRQHLDVARHIGHHAGADGGIGVLGELGHTGAGTHTGRATRCHRAAHAHQIGGVTGLHQNIGRGTAACQGLARQCGAIANSGVGGLVQDGDGGRACHTGRAAHRATSGHRDHVFKGIGLDRDAGAAMRAQAAVVARQSLNHIVVDQGGVGDAHASIAAHGNGACHQVGTERRRGQHRDAAIGFDAGAGRAGCAVEQLGARVGAHHVDTGRNADRSTGAGRQSARGRDDVFTARGRHLHVTLGLDLRALPHRGAGVLVEHAHIDTAHHGRAGAAQRSGNATGHADDARGVLRLDRDVLTCARQGHVLIDQHVLAHHRSGVQGVDVDHERAGHGRVAGAQACACGDRGGFKRAGQQGDVGQRNRDRVDRFRGLDVGGSSGVDDRVVAHRGVGGGVHDAHGHGHTHTGLLAKTATTGQRLQANVGLSQHIHSARGVDGGADAQGGVGVVGHAVDGDRAGHAVVLATTCGQAPGLELGASGHGLNGLHRHVRAAERGIGTGARCVGDIGHVHAHGGAHACGGVEDVGGGAGGQHGRVDIGDGRNHHLARRGRQRNARPHFSQVVHNGIRHANGGCHAHVGALAARLALALALALVDPVLGLGHVFRAAAVGVVVDLLVRFLVGRAAARLAALRAGLDGVGVARQGLCLDQDVATGADRSGAAGLDRIAQNVHAHTGAHAGAATRCIGIGLRFSGRGMQGTDGDRAVGIEGVGGQVACAQVSRLFVVDDGQGHAHPYAHAITAARSARSRAVLTHGLDVVHTCGFDQHIACGAGQRGTVGHQGVGDGVDDVHAHRGTHADRAALRTAGGIWLGFRHHARAGFSAHHQISATELHRAKTRHIGRGLDVGHVQRERARHAHLVRACTRGGLGRELVLGGGFCATGLGFEPQARGLDRRARAQRGLVDHIGHVDAHGHAHARIAPLGHGRAIGHGRGIEVGAGPERHRAGGVDEGVGACGGASGAAGHVHGHGARHGHRLRAGAAAGIGVGRGGRGVALAGGAVACATAGRGAVARATLTSGLVVHALLVARAVVFLAALGAGLGRAAGGLLRVGRNNHAAAGRQVASQQGIGVVGDHTHGDRRANGCILTLDRANGRIGGRACMRGRHIDAACCCEIARAQHLGRGVQVGHRDRGHRHHAHATTGTAAGGGGDGGLGISQHAGVTGTVDGCCVGHPGAGAFIDDIDGHRSAHTHRAALRITLGFGLCGVRGIAACTHAQGTATGGGDAGARRHTGLGLEGVDIDGQRARHTHRATTGARCGCGRERVLRIAGRHLCRHRQALGRDLRTGANEGLVGDLAHIDGHGRTDTHAAVAATTTAACATPATTATAALNHHRRAIGHRRAIHIGRGAHRGRVTRRHRAAGTDGRLRLALQHIHRHRTGHAHGRRTTGLAVFVGGLGLGRRACCGAVAVAALGGHAVTGLALTVLLVVHALLVGGAVVGLAALGAGLGRGVGGLGGGGRHAQGATSGGVAVKCGAGGVGHHAHGHRGANGCVIARGLAGGGGGGGALMSGLDVHRAAGGQAAGAQHLGHGVQVGHGDRGHRHHGHAAGGAAFGHGLQGVA